MTERRGELIQWFEDRGFGFIKPDEGDRDIFVGAHAFRDAGIHFPTRGMRVRFNIGQDARGRDRALDIVADGADRAAKRVFEPVRP